MSAKYSFYYVEVDGDDYAAMTIEDNIEEYLQRALYGEDQIVVDGIHIDITYKLFEFDTEEDKDKARKLAEMLMDFIDYDAGKTHNAYIVELAN